MQSTKTYGKTALVADVTANTQGYAQKAVAEIIDTALATIQQQVAAGTRVTIPGFGSWAPRKRAARTGTNIRTKQKIRIPATTSVGFTAGTEFKNAVKGRGK